MTILLAITSFSALLAAEASPRYLTCIEGLESDLEAGRQAAQDWAAHGGGAPAEHCLALADIAAGFPKLAAARLQDIADRKDAGDDYVRARLLSQAANAWLKANSPDNAQATLEAAKALAPDAGELELTAMRIHAAQEQWQYVLAAARKAERAGFSDAEHYVLKGRANLSLGALELAAKNVVSALMLEPYNLDALVLRGEIQQRGVMIDVFYGDDDKPFTPVE